MFITLHNAFRPFLIPLLLGTLILFGGILRLSNLDTQPYWMDEGYTINAVTSIVETGSSVLDSGKEYWCPVYCYPTAYLAETFGENAPSYRILAVIAGLVLIGALFFITRRLFDRNIAVLTSFFITFSYLQIAWSRQARWYTLFTLFFWLALYFFYKTLYDEKHTYRNLSLTALSTVLAVATHSIGYLLPLIFVAWLLIDQILIKKAWGLKHISLAVFFLGISALCTLYYFNPLAHITLSYTLPYYLHFYLRTYWLFIAFTLVAFFSARATLARSTYFLLFVYSAYLIPLSFFTNIVHYRYLFHVTPVLIILGSVGMYTTYSAIRSLWGKILFSLCILGVFATIGGGVFIPQTNYYLESDNPETLGDRPSYAYTPQPNWNAAYASIASSKKSDDLIISSHPHFTKIFLKEPGYWIKYNYLGFDGRNEWSENDREFYVGATIIDDLQELQSITRTGSGFIVFDYMAQDARISEDILSYIETNFELVFFEETNPFSKIWVYRF